MLISLPSYYKVAADDAWTPAEIFAQGVEGVWYEPADLSTLFQDEAMTVPVAADGDPVRVMLDKSPNGNHAIAPSDAARPVYRTDGTRHWLLLDGTDDFFKIPSVPVNSSDVLLSFAINAASTSRFMGWRPGAGQERFYVYTHGVRKGDGSDSFYAGFNLSEDIVISHVFKAAEATYRHNGVDRAASVDSWAGGFILNNYLAGSAQLNPDSVEARFSGRFYGGLMASPRPQDALESEQYLADLGGVTLP